MHLDSAIDSLLSKASDPNNVDVWVKYDNDDEATDAYVKTVPFDVKKVKFFASPKPTNLHAELNKLASICFGKYIFVFNDDCIMETRSWDKIALSKLKNSFKDGVVYGQTSDTSADKNKDYDYSSFPIISRAAFNALGYFMKEEFVGLGGDSSIYRIYKEIDRIVNLKEIVIDHIFHNSIEKVCNPDETAQQMRGNSWLKNIDPFSIDITKDLEKLKKSLYN
jgi:hypothetical protein